MLNETLLPSVMVGGACLLLMSLSGEQRIGQRENLLMDQPRVAIAPRPIEKEESDDEDGDLDDNHRLVLE